MSGAATHANDGIREPAIPEFKQIMGHPAPLWMLFMTEFWERFAFYGIRWALALYIVAEFFKGDAAGQSTANLIYGSYLAIVYAGAVFGGYVADRIIGYQRSILIGAVYMAAGLFMITIPQRDIFMFGLATIIVGNGMFKPNISTMVGKLYKADDARRDSGFTIFYMGINLGAGIAPILTQQLAQNVFNTGDTPAYKIVFFASGVGMLISLVWFYIGRRALKGIGLPPAGDQGLGRAAMVAAGALFVIPLVYFALKMGSEAIQWALSVLFIILAVVLLMEAIREGNVARDKCIAMLLIFCFNVMFWCFFEQAGSSFTFLADQLVEHTFMGMNFPVAWFQSVNSVALISLAPVIAWIWVVLNRFGKNPTIPRKFSLGLIFNGLSFAMLAYALTYLVKDARIPAWPLMMTYVLQSVGELCLSPIGLSMVTKLAPVRLVGFGMGGWFLSTGIGNNLSGIFAAYISGEHGMSAQSALDGYTMGFYILAGSGIVLFLIAPLIQKLMHGVK